MKKKIYMIFISIICSILLINLSVTPIMANEINSEENESLIEKRAIERYQKSVDIICGLYGYITVTVTIGHNMTTGRMWVDDIAYETHFDNGYQLVYVLDIYTDPEIGSTITGNSITVYVHFSQIGVNHWTESGTIEL